MTNGRSFSLDLANRQVNLLVEPERIFDEAEIIEVLENGEVIRGSVEDSMACAGKVLNVSEENDVRVTLFEDCLTGYVHLGKEWWFVEPLRPFRPEANPRDHLFYRTKDLRFKLDLSDDVRPRMVEQTLPESPPAGSGYLPPQPAPPREPVEHKVGPAIGIAMVADKEYQQEAKWTGSPWYMQQIGLLNNVNGVFKSNLACWFMPKIFLLTHAGLDDCTASLLLNDLEKVTKHEIGDLRRVQTRQSSGIECAHLTTGKNLEGKTLGIAWEPGVYSLSQQQMVMLTGGGGWGGPPNLAFQNMMLAAHELAHNFGGDHDLADEWCVLKFIVCLDYERSLMWPVFHDDNHPWISDGTLNPAHNNRKVMKDDMTSNRNHNF